MQGYKIRIPSPEISKLVQEKGFELGYRWDVRRHDLDNVKYTEFPELFFNEDKSIGYATNYIDSERRGRTLISYQDFLAIGEPEVNNQNNIIMSEIKLKLQTAPKNAKNVTVGREYIGILINDEDTQVDSLKEAKFFYCTNNSGLEARYAIKLFAEPAIARPAPQPPPPPVVWREFVQTVGFDGQDFNCIIRDNTQHLGHLGENYLEKQRAKCSCGIRDSDGINDLYGEITDFDFNLPAEISNKRNELYDLLFKMAIEFWIKSDSSAFHLFSTTTEDNEEICDIMDQLLEEIGGYSDTARNPNSSNEIQYWMFITPQDPQ